MKSYQRVDEESLRLRAHPWTRSDADSNSRYYDFRKDPALIRTCLEDFRPWERWPAMESFYELLEWLNGAESPFESNDCAFSGIETNESVEIQKPLVATGRVMILWRELPLNLHRDRVEWLERAIHHFLAQTDPQFEWGAIGTTVSRTQYVTLALPAAQQSGYQLILSFWSWGETEEVVMENLERTIRNLAAVLRVIGRGVNDRR